MKRIIGIDFGTSTTYMNVKRYHGSEPAEDKFSYMPVVFNYGESSGFVASIARENADGSFDFGEKAEEQLEGAKIYKEVKMRLEHPDGAQRAEARRVTEEFFKFLYETYTQQAANLGGADDTEETIVSYPVKWQGETVQFMLDAARKAGFQNVHGMDEATAAVMAVLCQNESSKLIYPDKPGYLMLVDMGAGTTDLVVCRYQTDGSGGVKIELVANWPRDAGEPTFGGREIDRVLERYIENYLAKALNPVLAPQAHVIATTPGQAKAWKEKNVSAGLSANKEVSTCAYIGTYKTMGMLTGEFPAFGRTEFEQMAAVGLRDYVHLLLGCLTDTGRQSADFISAGLDLVILTGGHSSWYFAREILDGTMAGYLDHPALARVRSQKNRVVNLSNPQTTVSLGLVYSKLPFRLEKETPRAEQKAEPKPEPEPKPELKPESAPQQAQTESGRYYKWDDRLLEIAKEFINNNLRYSNELHRSDYVAKLRENLGVPADDECFFAWNGGFFFLNEREGTIISDSGFYSSYHVTGVAHVTWPEFLNVTLEKGFFCWTLQTNPSSETLTLIGKNFVVFQEKLREASLALEDQ